MEKKSRDFQDNYQRLMAFSMCLNVAKVIESMRMFDSLSFFVRLINEILWDIKYFLILLGLVMLMFGVPLAFLHEGLINEVTGYWFLDVLLSQYLLAFELYYIKNKF